MPKSFQDLFHNPLVILGTLLFLNTFFFIAKQVKHLQLVETLRPVPNSLFYGVFFLLFIAWLGFSFQKKLFFLAHLRRSLLFFLPATLVLLYGIAFSDNFHFLFQISSGLALILTLGLIFYHYFERHPSQENSSLSIKGWFHAQGKLVLFAIFFFTAVFFGFATYRLGQFAAVDEPLWLYGRIEKFWNNVYEREWEKTDVSDKPGITVAITSGAGLLRYEPSHFDDKRLEGEVFTKQHPEGMESFFFTFRFPLVVLITLLLPLVYFFLERLLCKRDALFSYALLTTSPILIGIAKIINPDALLWLFTTLSLLSYLVFQKRSWYRYLFLSGLFLGLALLTKYIANIIFIYLLALLFLEYLYHPKQSQKLLSAYIRTTFVHIGFVIFTALATFYLLLPANWVEPIELVRSTLLSEAFVKVAPLFVVIVTALLADQRWNQNRATAWVLHAVNKYKEVLSKGLAAVFLGALLFTITNTWAGMAVYDFIDLLSSPKTIEDNGTLIGIFLANFYPLAFSLTPLALLGVLIAIFALFQKNFYQHDALRLAFYSLLFTLIYYLGATVNSVGSIIRYQIIIFPLFALIGGIGLSYLVAILQKQVRSQRGWVTGILFSLVITSSLYTLWNTPFPLSYASSLLPLNYSVDLKDMGPGSYEIAKQLNQLPNAENILIWTDKDGVCQFFVGRCKRGSGREAITDKSVNYIVVSSARESRSDNMILNRFEKEPQTVLPIPLFYDRENPDLEVQINGRPTHWVRAFKYEGN